MNGVTWKDCKFSHKFQRFILSHTFLDRNYIQSFKRRETYVLCFQQCKCFQILFVLLTIPICFQQVKKANFYIYIAFYEIRGRVVISSASFEGCF